MSSKRPSQSTCTIQSACLTAHAQVLPKSPSIDIIFPMRNLDRISGGEKDPPGMPLVRRETKSCELVCRADTGFSPKKNQISTNCGPPSVASRSLQGKIPMASCGDRGCFHFQDSEVFFFFLISSVAAVPSSRSRLPLMPAFASTSYLVHCPNSNLACKLENPLRSRFSCPTIHTHTHTHTHVDCAAIGRELITRPSQIAPEPTSPTKSHTKNDPRTTSSLHRQNRCHGAFTTGSSPLRAGATSALTAQSRVLLHQRFVQAISS